MFDVEPCICSSFILVIFSWFYVIEIEVWKATVSLMLTFLYQFDKGLGGPLLLTLPRATSLSEGLIMPSSNLYLVQSKWSQLTIFDCCPRPAFRLSYRSITATCSCSCSFTCRKNSMSTTESTTNRPQYHDFKWLSFPSQNPAVSKPWQMQTDHDRRVEEGGKIELVWGREVWKETDRKGDRCKELRSRSIYRQV